MHVNDILIASIFWYVVCAVIAMLCLWRCLERFMSYLRYV